MCIRYRKAVRGYKYIENDFYSNDSSNEDLESRNATSESQVIHQAAMLATESRPANKKMKTPAECLEVGSATTRSSQGELTVLSSRNKKGVAGVS